MRKILVTGGSGFIGQAVVKELRMRGDEAKILDRPQTIMIRGDLDYALAGTSGVINLAGVLGTEETLGAERQAAQVNVIGAINVYDAAADRGLPVVQIGTGHKGQPNPYAITKACAEDIGLARAEFRNEHIVVVRAYHAYGPGQKVGPPHGKATVRKIIPSFVCRALTGMPIQINGDGLQEIDLVDVSEVAQTLVGALDAKRGSVIEAGTGVATTVLDAAKDVIAATDSDSDIVFGPMRPGEPPNTRVVAGFPAMACRHPWPYRIDETVEYYRVLLESVE